jgi:hypothetical protein
MIGRSDPRENVQDYGADAGETRPDDDEAAPAAGGDAVDSGSPAAATTTPSSLPRRGA